MRTRWKALTLASFCIAFTLTSSGAWAQPPAGRPPHVRVLSTDGIVREGRLLSLSATEVVLARGRQSMTLPIEDVRRIERLTHGVRNGLLAGALAGFGLGMAVSCASTGDDGGCWPLVGATVAGVGAGLGTAIGALHDTARRGSNVIYGAPGETATIEVPTVIVAGASGGVLRRRGTEITAPAFQTAIQFPLSRSTSLEVEAMHWSWHRPRQIIAIADESWRTLTLTGGVAWRIGTPATAGTVALGAGVQRSTLQGSRCVRDCAALPPYRTFASHFVEVTPHAQIAGGIERALTRRLAGFGTVRLVMGKEAGLAAVGGVRLVLASRTLTMF
jgi:hypothetical protein